MYEIPTEPKWMVWGRDSDEKITKFDRCDSQAEADANAERMRNGHPELTIEIQPHDAVIPDRTLPTAEQIEGICWILHGALVMIRNLGHAADKTDAMREIAEVLHETPQEMFNPNSWDWHSTLARLRKLEEDYPDARTYGMARRFEEIYKTPNKRLDTNA